MTPANNGKITPRARERYVQIITRSSSALTYSPIATPRRSALKSSPLHAYLKVHTTRTRF